MVAAANCSRDNNTTSMGISSLKMVPDDFDIKIFYFLLLMRSRLGRSRIPFTLGKVYLLFAAVAHMGSVELI
jgi:hypothetical protein